jgi:uncharacterized membrane protein YciS (DUF1049 family)
VQEFISARSVFHVAFLVCIIFLLLLILKITIAMFLFLFSKKSVENYEKNLQEKDKAEMEELLSIERFTVYKGRVL